MWETVVVLLAGKRNDANILAGWKDVSLANETE